MPMLYNPELLRMAEWRLAEDEKAAFVAAQPPGDPSQGGAPGGAPPGAAPGGPPPGGDPAAAGGAPPGPDPFTALNSKVDQLMQALQMQQGGGQAGGAGAGGMAGKPAKPDLNMVAMDTWHNKKLITGLYHAMGIDMPKDLLDGPNRDPATGMPMPLGAAGSTSDPAYMQQQQAAQGGQGGQGGQAQPQSAIPPIEPMQPAMPTPTQPGAAAAGKSAEADENFAFGSRAEALAYLLDSLHG